MGNVATNPVTPLQPPFVLQLPSRMRHTNARLCVQPDGAWELQNTQVYEAFCQHCKGSSTHEGCPPDYCPWCGHAVLLADIYANVGGNLEPIRSEEVAR